MAAPAYAYFMDLFYEYQPKFIAKITLFILFNQTFSSNRGIFDRNLSSNSHF
jgi:hypothetical protein